MPTLHPVASVAAVMDKVIPKTDRPNEIPFVGIASTEMRDIDGEVALQDGLDWEYAVRYGRVKDTHAMEGSSVVGHLTKAEPITLADGTRATWVEGVIYDDESTRPLIRKLRLAQAAGRPFGLSIEATQVEKGPNGTIRRGKVLNVAITGWAANPGTFVSLMKDALQERGLTFGEPHPYQGDVEGGAALVPQSLQGNSSDRRKSMDSIAKFLETLSEEDKESLKAALLGESSENEDGATNEAVTEPATTDTGNGKKKKWKVTVTRAPANTSDKVVGTMAPAAMKSRFTKCKSAQDIVYGVTPGEINITEFLESITNRLIQGFGEMRTVLERLLRQVEDMAAKNESTPVTTQGNDQQGFDLAATLSEIKSAIDEMRRSPIAVKSASFGAPTDQAVGGVTRSLGKSPEVIKALLLAKGQDVSLTKEARMSALYLAAKMESGHMPSDVELARHGISL